MLRGVISKISAYERWKVQSVIIGSLTYFRKYFRRSSSHAWKIMDALFIARSLFLIITWFRFIYRLVQETVMNLLKEFTVDYLILTLVRSWSKLSLEISLLNRSLQKDTFLMYTYIYTQHYTIFNYRNVTCT